MAMMTPASRRSDSIFGLAIMVLGAGVMFEGSRLRPSPFDPLGPGGVPIGVGALLVIFAGYVFLSAIFGSGVGGGQRMFSGLEDGEADQPLKWRRSLTVYGISLLYLAALPIREIDFFPATVIYMIILLLFLGDRNWRSILIAAALSISVAFVLDQVFRRLLSVNLP